MRKIVWLTVVALGIFLALRNLAANGFFSASAGYQVLILSAGLLVAGFAIGWFIIPAGVGTVRAEIQGPSTWQMLKQNGHLMRSGWRFWFLLLLILTAGSGLVFAICVATGNGPMAFKAGIICFVSCVLMLLIMKKLPQPSQL